MAKNREVRLEGEFRRALSEIFLTDLKDPRVSAMLSASRTDRIRFFITRLLFEYRTGYSTYRLISCADSGLFPAHGVLRPAEV